MATDISFVSVVELFESSPLFDSPVTFDIVGGPKRDGLMDAFECALCRIWEDKVPFRVRSDGSVSRSVQLEAQVLRIEHAAESIDNGGYSFIIAANVNVEPLISGAGMRIVKIFYNAIHHSGAMLIE